MVQPTQDAQSRRANKLGRQYGKAHRLEDVASTEDMYQEALRMGCPLSFFDVFKYGAQDVWRESGQLPDRS